MNLMEARKFFLSLALALVALGARGQCGTDSSYFCFEQLRGFKHDGRMLSNVIGLGDEIFYLQSVEADRSYRFVLCSAGDDLRPLLMELLTTSGNVLASKTDQNQLAFELTPTRAQQLMVRVSYPYRQGQMMADKNLCVALMVGNRAAEP